MSRGLRELRYLGDGFATCPVCDGCGVQLDSGRDCGYCDGIGSILLDHCEPLVARPSRSNTTVWSPLLCDPDTISRALTTELEEG